MSASSLTIRLDQDLKESAAEVAECRARIFY